jgi:hypothetical protein
MDQAQSDALIASALRDLERKRDEVSACAERVIEETRGALESLKTIGARDVFKDAVVLAVGELSPRHPIDISATAYVQNLGDHLPLRVVASRLTPTYLTDLEDSRGNPRRLKAMLVIWDEGDEATVPRPGIAR